MAENGVKTKRSRAWNLTKSEIEVFVSLAPVYKNIIECKRTDAQTRSEKAEGWNTLCDAFNAQSTVHFRSVDNLKSLWDNLKKGARKAASHERTERNKTGGGERNRNGDPSLTDLTVLSIMGPSGVGLFNQFDGDANAPSGSHYDLNISEIDFPSVPAPEPHVAVTYEDEAFDTSDMQLTSSPNDAVTSRSPRSSATVIKDTSKEKWGEYLPKILYHRKSDALRVNVCADGSSHSSSEQSTSSATMTSSGSDKAMRKRTISEEAEWMKNCKRRRPVLCEDVDAKELVKAKLALARLSKEQLEDESKRRQELHEVEMRKKVKEAELLELQVLKLKKELGLE